MNTLRRHLLFAALLFALACRAEDTATAPEGDLVILHTNDIHGHFLPEAAGGKNGEAGKTVGGFDALDSWLRAHRKECGPSLLLDGGDLMTGNPICDFEDNGVKGGDLVEMEDIAGYDGAIIGNHDLDYGIENLQGLEKHFKFPLLCANLTLSDGTPLAKEAYHIYQVGPFHVGVIGLIMREETLSGMESKATMARLKVLDPAETAKKIVADIASKVDVVIVVTHEGIDADKRLAEKLGPEVGLIVGGHDHRTLNKPVTANGIPIVEAGTGLSHLGKTTLHVKDHKVTSVQEEMISLDPQGAAPGDDMKKLVDADDARVKEKFGEVVGELETAWNKEGLESNEGEFVVDALRGKCGTDFAVINGSTLRKDLPAGKVTLLDLYEVDPFSDSVVTFECSGKELLDILAHSPGKLQVSGITCTLEREGRKGARVVEATVGGKPIDPEKTYRGAGNSYAVVEQAQKYLGLEVKNKQDTGTDVRTVLIEAVRKRGKIDGKTDGRITEK